MNDLFLSLGAILQIMLVNVVLSGDNAVVIAMAAHNLPEHQRRKAMLWGCLFAIVFRLVLTLVVAYVLMIPGVRFAGAVLLAWIACKLLQDETAVDQTAEGAPGTLRKAIGRIALADLVMSLDNVIAIAGVSHSNPAQLVLGLVMSIVTILAFSTTIIAIMDRFRWISYLGTAVLAATAGQLMWHDVESLQTGFLAMHKMSGLSTAAGWFFQAIVVVGCLTSNRWWPSGRRPAPLPEFNDMVAAVNDGMQMATDGPLLENHGT